MAALKSGEDPSLALRLESQQFLIKITDSNYINLPISIFYSIYISIDLRGSLSPTPYPLKTATLKHIAFPLF